MSSSHFGELWLAWSHGGGITSGMSYAGSSKQNIERSGEGRWAVRIGGGGVA